MEPPCSHRETASHRGSALAKPLAPEDVRVGDYVALLDYVVEFAASSCGCQPHWQSGGESQLYHVERLRYLTPADRQVPLQVLAICLPLVLAKPPRGEVQTLDGRQVRPARLSRRYARTAWKATCRRR